LKQSVRFAGIPLQVDVASPKIQFWTSSDFSASKPAHNLAEEACAVESNKHIPCHGILGQLIA
jgi:hypothetical protein